MSDREIMNAKNYGPDMNKMIETIASHIIEEIDDHIDNTIHWALDDDSIEYTDELELKIKQQVLFSLIKRVTK
jgi:hypothetical protein